jgi:hypothetical protein
VENARRKPPPVEASETPRQGRIARRRKPPPMIVVELAKLAD